jgi:hypothetical protein
VLHGLQLFTQVYRRGADGQAEDSIALGENGKMLRVESYINQKNNFRNPAIPLNKKPRQSLAGS